MPKQISGTNLNFDPKLLFRELSEKEKSQLLSSCSLIINNPSFKQVCDELSTQAVINAFSVKGISTTDFAFQQGLVAGISDVYETILGYHLQYLESVKKEDDYDKHEII